MHCERQITMIGIKITRSREIGTTRYFRSPSPGITRCLSLAGPSVCVIRPMQIVTPVPTVAYQRGFIAIFSQNVILPRRRRPTINNQRRRRSTLIHCSDQAPRLGRWTLIAWRKILLRRFTLINSQLYFVSVAVKRLSSNHGGRRISRHYFRSIR